MTRMIRWGCVCCLIVLAAGLWMAGCTNGQPQLVFGPPTFTNVPPELEILEPAASFSINQGERFDIRWSDRDPDSAAKISFSLVQEGTEFEILLVSNIDENDSVAADSFSVATSLIPFGNYNIKGVITDGFNPPVTVFAMTSGSTGTRVIANVGEPGINPLNTPPSVFVAQPSFNQGVAQDDALQIVVRPTADPNDTTTPFDPEDDTTLFVLLDLDDDPENDDPRVPDPASIIVLRQTDITMGDATPQMFTIPIDLATIPPRPDGSPYFVRATILDPGNLPVHDYADGTIQILRSATGVVDVGQIGRTLSGVRFVGFNPGSLLGSDMCGVGDFDADGVEDFLMVAKFGNPRNFGNIGEAYLVYGLDNVRFGGEINVNSVSSGISGTIFEAPPNRLDHLHVQSVFDPRGITSVSSVTDLTGDGRPELLFGMSLVDGMYQGRDDDPGDDPDTIRIESTLRQGLFTLTRNGVADDSIDDNFQGVIDTYLDRNNPSANFGAVDQLQFGAAVMDQGDQFPIIGFDLPPEIILLDPGDVSNLQATLRFTLSVSSPITDMSFTVNRLLGPIANDLSYSDFGFDGTPGPTTMTEFDDSTLDFSVNLFGTAQVEVDVTDTIQGILDGEIGTLSPAWIVVTGAEVISGAFFSSEADEALRPVLEVNFDLAQAGFAQNTGCYPDTLPNNKSDRPPPNATNPPHDSTFEAVGSVIFMASENRDLAGFVNPDRLEATSVALELAGQDNPPVGLNPTDSTIDAPTSTTPQPTGTITTLAGDGGMARTRACRLASGWYDYINDSAFGDTRGRADPRADYFGEHVASMPDVDNDSLPEIIVSAPRNELYLKGLRDAQGACLTTLSLGDQRNCEATSRTGSIIVYPSSDYSSAAIAANAGNAQSLPSQDPGFGLGSCTATPRVGRAGTLDVRGGFEVFAEAPEDFLGGAEHAGDVNLDGVPDLVCGAPQNDNSAGLVDTGAVYIIYGRRPVGDVQLVNLDNPALRPPTIRIRGETAGDRIGQVQTAGLDINGDRVDDVFFGSPSADFAVQPDQCGDLDGNGVVDASDLDVDLFNACRSSVGDEVFVGDGCKPFDFDNDRDIDGEDRVVFDCLVGGFTNCCPVDNGFVGVVFGNVNLDGDRSISQVATTSLPGIRFFGANPGDRAGADIVSARDFNRDGFGDLLIAAPGVRFIDNNGRERMGVAYLIFGGTHLDGNLSFSLDRVGTPELPGIVFWSPFESGRPDEAPIDHVGALGDINNDGFDDIAIGVTRADFVDTSLPQDPNAPGFDPNVGRRPDDGSIYIVYGNNTGSNR